MHCAPKIEKVQQKERKKTNDLRFTDFDSFSRRPYLKKCQQKGH